MNKVFLARFPGKIIPLAIVLPPTGPELPQLPPVPWADNDGALTSKFFGALIESRPASQAKVASNHSATNEVPRFESQQTAMVQPMPVPQQEADAPAPLISSSTKRALPMVPAASFVGRWGGLQ